MIRLRDGRMVGLSDLVRNRIVRRPTGNRITTMVMFWRQKSLAEMSKDEWESLCDGCARCCLVKLEDEESGEVVYTDLTCRLLNLDSCRCTRYADRQSLVPDCVSLDPELASRVSWLPSTCAYRRLAEGKDLPEWHPLITGDLETVHLAGVSVRHRAISETEVVEEDLEDHVVDWPA